LQTLFGVGVLAAAGWTVALVVGGQSVVPVIVEGAGGL
jgi:hypothetical protein